MTTLQAFSPSTTPTPDPTISIVLPTLNEAANLPHVLCDIPQDVHQLILVDGGSVDGTVDVARSLFPRVEVVQQTRKGKGNALACGFERCTGDIIVMIDADGSTSPKEIPDFVAALTGGAAFAKGTRFAKGGRSLDITFRRRLGNLMLNTVVNVLFRTRFSDLCYGYNAFWRDVLPVLQLPSTDLAQPADGSKLWGDGFEIETLINIRVARAFRKQIAEVASIEAERIHGESNLNAVSDGLRVMRTILSERFGTRRTAAPATKPLASRDSVRRETTAHVRQPADLADDVVIKRAS
ncbi:glycosyltransferase involved in cell wall biosynthesis [Friedmanniella endophytica]|uniref:Glycosyltransferase involved in cell wall biosynthesis n=1 Tax=Microlunatus kandeliicorticis TaxID=1759536 RepID=A0A7W3IP73_9ACTN|nr:glycosyltransferase family 2 protein [Microlunatus kandeliicorticis]MBA8792650.1 glycosyltransferase involved in cell wall biosynthesis [Microlunatus kandeliicorticis]